MRSLYLRIYLTVLLALALFALASGWLVQRHFEHERERFVATASKRLREGRIFVDYLRNGRGATCVASYSLRARPGAPVAMPIAWQALSRVASADAFALGAPLLRRIARDADAE